MISKKNIKEELIWIRPVAIASALSFITGIIGFLYFKERIIIELGVIVFVVDLIWETYGTQKGLWRYEQSKIFMIKKVPIEIPFLAMSCGLASGTIILFLLSVF